MFPTSPNPVNQDVNLTEKYSLAVSKPDSSSSKVEMEFLQPADADSSQDGQTNFTYDSDVKTDAPKNQATTAIVNGLQSIIGVKLDFFLNATNGLIGSKRASTP